MALPTKAPVPSDLASAASVNGDPAAGNAANDPTTGQTKSDYRFEVDDSDQSHGLLSEQSQERPPRNAFGLASSNAGSLQMIDQVAHHPALPVACYCLASILMTVVNKVSPHLISSLAVEPPKTSRVLTRVCSLSSRGITST